MNSELEAANQNGERHEDDLDERPTWAADLTGFALRAESFENGGVLPARFTTAGHELSPALAWGAPPPGSRSLCLIVEDVDAPGGPQTLWAVVGLRAAPGDLVEGRGTDPSDVAEAVALVNDRGGPGWAAPVPPRDGAPPRRYRFRLLALQGELELGPEARRAELDRALAGRVLAEATLMARSG